MLEDVYDYEPPIVTVTGADDWVDPMALAQLSERFPFVEWGILYSTKREGSPRYPSRDWMDQLVWHQGNTYPMHLSLHVCGKAARDLLGGNDSLLETWCPPFYRVQLNGYDWDSQVATRLYEMWSMYGCEFILQARSTDALGPASVDADRIHGSVLYDPSGGRGRHPGAWPDLRLGKVGVAGGLTPETAWSTYEQVQPMGASWVDLESGVRTDDRFDLAKVEATMKPFAVATEVVGVPPALLRPQPGLCDGCGQEKPTSQCDCGEELCEECMMRSEHQHEEEQEN